MRRDRQPTSFSEPQPFIDTLLLDQYLNEATSASSSEGGGDIASGQTPTSPTAGGSGRTDENKFYLAAALDQPTSDRVLSWDSSVSTHHSQSVVSPGNTSIFSLALPNSGGTTESSTAPSTPSSSMTFNRWQSSRLSPTRTNSERRQILTMGSGMGLAGTDYPMAFASGSMNVCDAPEDTKKADIIRNLPYRLLDAPLLRNDYYANLITWSHQCGKVAVGLGCEVYLWHEDEGASLLRISDNRSAIMCVSFNTVNDLLLVGCRNGMIYIADAPKATIVAKYDHRSARRGHSPECGVCSALWIPNRKDLLIFGDESGYTGVIGLKSTGDSSELLSVAELGGHFQQICGMASRHDGSEIAIGCNDNTCSIWDISCLQTFDWTQNVDVTLKHTLLHNAAVKAIAYCPWSPSLVATGGGSHDRTIRFWHTGTGTLIKKIPVHAQVTSIFWSRYNRQFVATFGFSDPGTGSLISVFTFPECEPLVQVTSRAGLRFLSASQSANDGQVAVTSNDETVRFYEIWPVIAGAAPKFPKSGIYGSDLIELIEGIERPEAIIR